VTPLSEVIDPRLALLGLGCEDVANDVEPAPEGGTEVISMGAFLSVKALYEKAPRCPAWVNEFLELLSSG